jgi:hypothetical protein
MFGIELSSKFLKKKENHIFNLFMTGFYLPNCSKPLSITLFEETNKNFLLKKAKKRITPPNVK